MFKKYLLTISILLVIVFLSGPLGISRNTVSAHGHRHGHSGCRFDSCGNCGHYVCPGDCNKCVDCLNERIRALESQLEK